MLLVICLAFRLNGIKLLRDYYEITLLIVTAKSGDHGTFGLGAALLLIGKATVVRQSCAHVRERHQITLLARSAIGPIGNLVRPIVLRRPL